MPEIAYEDQHIRVIWSQGKSDFLFVTFSDMTRLADGMRFTADKAAAKADLTCLAFMPKSRNWYPKSSVLPAVAAIAGRLESHAVKVLYGCSMGGYGALKYSAAVGATQMLSLCPQWSLDPAEVVHVDRRYAAYFDPSLAGMGIRAADVAGRAFVLRDPDMRLDLRHCLDLTSNCPDTVMIDAHNCGHRIATILSGSDNLLSLISTARFGRRDDMQALVNRLRRAHYLRGMVVLARASYRRPLTSSRILRHRFLHETRYAALASKLMSPLSKSLEAGGHIEESQALRKTFEGVDAPFDAAEEMMEDLSPLSCRVAPPASAWL